MLFVLIAWLMVAGPSWPADMYRLSRVDYFMMKAGNGARTIDLPLWEEDGHRPPRVVVELLDDPGERTARQYLEWNRVRLEKIAAAQRALDAALARAPEGKVP